MAVADQRLKAFLLKRTVNEWQPVARKPFVQDNAAYSCINDTVLILADGCTHHVLGVVLKRKVDEVALPAKTDLRLRLDDLRIESEQNIVNRVERLTFALQLITAERKVIAAKNDVLRGNRDRLSARRRQQVVRRKH